MITLLIFAGGRGTRLFGPNGGCKAATKLTDDLSLISYALFEGIPLSLTPPAVLLSTDGCEELPDSLGQWRPPVDVIRAPAGGTARAVVDLLARSAEQISVVLPGDVVGERGALNDFIKQATRIVRESGGPLCVIATTDIAPDESDPGFVVSTEAGIVLELGKGATPTEETWVGVRVLNQAFARLYVESWDGQRDDEQQMSNLATHLLGSVRSLRCASLFDVDDELSLSRARVLASGWGY
ncbi:hypothetical protein [Arthrobacter sp. HY1533]|uniref:hypothetical protein n=1 Tax=Arthrobacter sp. HY1533 TaxID=2970919 RepID=UPI0022B9F7F6|nr:hypothetical protein [Arthrobacter sp. HY1533]